LPDAPDLATIAIQLKPLLTRQATTSRSRRFALAATCCLLPVALTGNYVYNFATKPHWVFPNFEVEVLRRSVERLDAFEHQGTLSAEQLAEKQALDAYIGWESSDYGLLGHAFTPRLYARAFMPGPQYRLWQQIHARYGALPAVTPEMIDSKSMLS